MEYIPLMSFFRLLEFVLFIFLLVKEKDPPPSPTNMVPNASLFASLNWFHAPIHKLMHKIVGGGF